MLLSSKIKRVCNKKKQIKSKRNKVKRIEAKSNSIASKRNTGVWRTSF